MKIAIGADHAGYDVKEKIKEHLQEREIFIQDFGTHSSDSTDYPLIAVQVGRVVSQGDADYGILICGSGNGMSMAANKIKGIRAALGFSENLARMSREHNNANILVLAARYTELDELKRAVIAFLETPFEVGGRHERRVNQIHELTNL